MTNSVINAAMQAWKLDFLSMFLLVAILRLQLRIQLMTVEKIIIISVHLTHFTALSASLIVLIVHSPVSSLNALLNLSVRCILTLLIHPVRSGWIFNLK